MLITCTIRPTSYADQGHWSLTARDFEREVLPMTRYEGMSVAPWGVLGQVCPPSPLAFRRPILVTGFRRLRRIGANLAASFSVYVGQVQDGGGDQGAHFLPLRHRTDRRREDGERRAPEGRC